MFPPKTAATMDRPLTSQLAGLDKHAYAALKEQAIAKARELQQKAAKATQDRVKQAAIIAHDIVQSKNASDAGSKAWRHWLRVQSGPIAQAVARALICVYFMNLVYESYETWSFLTGPDMRERVQQFPDRFPRVHFPYIGVVLLLPCAVLVAFGIRVTICASVLVIDMLKDSAELIWAQTWMFLMYGQRPNELMVKKLAVLGCAALVLAHGVRDSKRMSSYAGLLITDDKQQAGTRKSIVLLVGRLLMTLLFVYVGIGQIERVLARDYMLWRNHGHHPWGIKDGHDNNWLLLEFLLSLPFAVGYKTETVSTLLASTLMTEAFTCWPFWSSRWPTWHYAAHVRSHFVTNCAVAGGLLLLQGFGAGKFTVDQLLKKKDK